MDLLILGGSRFVGLHLVNAALSEGHRVTTFNRGVSRAQPLPGTEAITGDRDGGLEALGRRTWDAVIDTSGYFPRLVRDSARYLANRTKLYLFISTISVYRDFTQAGLTEDAPLATTNEPAVEDIGEGRYGPLKALCESEVLAAYADRALIVRPGLIVGPHDPTDRFTYWPLRVAAGGEFLAPDSPSVPTQFIDARDLAAFCVSLVGRRQTGIYHATGAAYAASLGDVVDACQAAGGSDAAATWIPEEFLLEQGVTPWLEVPLWVPRDRQGLVTVNCGKAFAAGLVTRPLAETVSDTLAWARGRGEAPLRAGLSRERERELLTRWRAAAH